MSQEIRQVKVELGERSYPIHIGYGILPQCTVALSGANGGQDLFLISDSNVFPLYGEKLLRLLSGKACNVYQYIMPAGEEAKSWETASALLTKMLEANLSRQAQVIALGGGVVGDMAGFAAALYRRGISFYQIPTTLLAQVDSSVGGKVAVNHPLGKNMLGTFYQPRAVWADLSLLESLPLPEWRAGLAEVIKYGCIWDASFFEFLEENADKVLERSPEVLPFVIERCCRIKAEIVGRDERDEGLRNILNFGHTVGHALESATQYKTYRHGEAVAVGMLAAFMLARTLKMTDDQTVERLRKLLHTWGLPCTVPARLLDTAAAQLIYDKKASAHELVFILPERLGQAVIKKGVTLKEAKDAMRRISAN
ncbi:MAG: 3-dehydroquinate synthase [Clostridia bacterium]|jgi:3-dehydroquinate synthase|nr:3-dehydroquinate synthase [Clostridia bacterium]